MAQFLILQNSSGKNSWVDDELILFYNKFKDDQLAKAKVPWKVLFFDPVIWKVALQCGWTSTKTHLSSYDYIVCPTHFENHWALIIIAHIKAAYSNGHGAVYILDPKCFDHQKAHLKVYDILAAAAWEQDHQVLQKRNLKFYEAQERVLPQQPSNNTTDCGLYIMVYVEMLLKDPRTFLRDIAEGRRSMIKSLKGSELRKCLLMLLEEFANAELEDDCLLDQYGKPIIDGDLCGVFLWSKYYPAKTSVH